MAVFRNDHAALDQFGESQSPRLIDSFNAVQAATNRPVAVDERGKNDARLVPGSYGGGSSFDRAALVQGAKPRSMWGDAAAGAHGFG